MVKGHSNSIFVDQLQAADGWRYFDFMVYVDQLAYVRVEKNYVQCDDLGQGSQGAFEFYIR